MTGVAITPDARRVVSASWNKTLRVWDLESRQTLLMLDGHTGGVGAVTVTPDGLGDESGQVHLLRLIEV